MEYQGVEGSFPALELGIIVFIGAWLVLHAIRSYRDDA